jgi:hypothetical protein
MTHFADPPTKFPAPLAQSGSVTSHLAAGAVGGHAHNQRRMVWEFVLTHPLVTREQISIGLRLPEKSVSPRVFELLEKKMLTVYDRDGRTASGHRAERLSCTGRFYHEVPPTPPRLQLTLPLEGPNRDREPQASDRSRDRRGDDAENQVAALSEIELAALRERLFERLPALRARWARNPDNGIVAEQLIDQFRRERAVRSSAPTQP